MGTTSQFSFGNGSLLDINWYEIKEHIDNYKPKTFLEIGCGYSTYLISQHVAFVVSLDTSIKWIDRVKEDVGDNVTLINYEYPNFPDLSIFPKFDYAFVDGPENSKNSREDSIRLATRYSDRIFIHDCSRKQMVPVLDSVFKSEDGWKIVRFRAGLCIAAKSGEDEVFNSWLEKHHGNNTWPDKWS